MSYLRLALAVCVFNACLALQLPAQLYSVGTTLPKDFVPLSAKQTVKRLQSVGSKSEFERWGAYFERQRATAPDLFSGPVVFDVRDTKCAGFFTEYDADKHRFKIRWELDGALSILERAGLATECERRIGGRFTGSNAYGVQRNVTVQYDTTYGLQWGARQYATTVKGEFRMAPADAEIAKPFLRVYVAGRLKELRSVGFVERAVGGDRATIDNPVTTYETNYRIGLTGVTLLVVDSRTRKVLWTGRQAAMPLKNYAG